MSYCSIHGAMNVTDCAECAEDPHVRAIREEIERDGRDLSFQSAAVDQPPVPVEDDPIPLDSGSPASSEEPAEVHE